MNNTEELLELLDLEKLEENLFRGQNYVAPWGRIFGGQVLAQSLHAANQTVPEDRCAHSMHGYFILAGDPSVPVVYQVDRLRDGGSFATRRVTAIQKGRPIFNMAASFQLDQPGVDHQIEMPEVPQPEDVQPDMDYAYELKDSNPDWYRRLSLPKPIEFRTVEKIDYANPGEHGPIRHVWMRAIGELPDDKRAHQEVLAYGSDYSLLTTAFLPHFKTTDIRKVFFASLDHAMWFHRDFRIDDWLLYALESPSASNSRGFSRGNIFNRAGKLVASVTQEGLMRIMDERKKSKSKDS
jgi:acyl-CoA thioesterase-2